MNTDKMRKKLLRLQVQADKKREKAVIAQHDAESAQFRYEMFLEEVFDEYVDLIYVEPPFRRKSARRKSSVKQIRRR